MVGASPIIRLPVLDGDRVNDLNHLVFPEAVEVWMGTFRILEPTSDEVGDQIGQLIANGACRLHEADVIAYPGGVDALIRP